MKDVRNKIILDAITNPISFFLFVGGLTEALISFGVDGGLKGFFPGFVAVLLSITYSGTILAYTDWNKAAEEYFSTVEENKSRDLNKELDNLYEKLKRDDCRVNQKYLRDLRTFKEIFDKDKKSEKLTLYIGNNLIEEVENLFAVCIERLKKDNELYVTQKKISKNLKLNIKKTRDKNIKEIGKTVEEFGKLVNELHEIILDDLDLSKDRKNVESSVLMAQSLKDRLDNLRDPLSKYDDEDFDDWAKKVSQ